MRRPVVVALVTAACAAVACALAASGAAASTVWLCKPGLANSPCISNLTTAVTNGKTHHTTIAHLKADPKAPADCFYIYPTVSDQKTIQADLTIDPVERSIALYQADYYSQYCRIFAPMYRQFTLTVLNGMPTNGPPANPALAMQDVEGAFMEYMQKYNHGRPFVFISHSQGSGQLQQLIAKDVDPVPAVRKLMLSAIILGGNVTVANGSDTGGSFKTIPACRSVKQLHCVVAFSSFASATPPTPGTRFGRTNNPGQHVLCNNPAALAGGTRALATVFPTEPFAAGTIATVSAVQGLPTPSTKTPWIETLGGYTGACLVSADNDNYLSITPIAPAPPIKEISAAFGLHLVDANIALGNLVEMVHSEIGVWLKQHPKPKPKAKHHH